MMSSFWMECKAEVIAQYQEQKQIADAALGRIDDTTFFTRLKQGGDAESNSIAVLIKHISGNFIPKDGMAQNVFMAALSIKKRTYGHLPNMPQHHNPSSKRPPGRAAMAARPGGRGARIGSLS